jgi:ATP-dependent helicase/nuclease subunit A
VSDLKRAWAADRESEDRPADCGTGVSPVLHRRLAGATRTARPVARPAFLSDGPAEMDNVGRGIATHRLLQVLDLTRPCDPEDLRQQRDAIVEANRMPAFDAAAVKLEDVAWFFATDLGVLVRQCSSGGLDTEAHRRDAGATVGVLVRQCSSGDIDTQVHRPDAGATSQVLREVPFVSRVPPERVDAMVHARDHRDVLLVRGMVDLLICGPAELSIVDFKTDDVSAEGCEERAEAYRSQLAYYAEAMAAAYHLPVAHRWLVFLKARRIIELRETM